VESRSFPRADFRSDLSFQFLSLTEIKGCTIPFRSDPSGVHGGQIASLPGENRKERDRYVAPDARRSLSPGVARLGRPICSGSPPRKPVSPTIARTETARQGKTGSLRSPREATSIRSPQDGDRLGSGVAHLAKRACSSFGCLPRGSAICIATLWSPIATRLTKTQVALLVLDQTSLLCSFVAGRQFFSAVFCRVRVQFPVVSRTWRSFSVLCREITAVVFLFV
jgi:hypothetical protein